MGPNLIRVVAERLEWPSNGPDLKPTGHLWDQLRRAVRETVLANVLQIRS